MDHIGRPPGNYTISLTHLGNYDFARKLVVARAMELLRAARRVFPKWNPPPYNPKVYAKLLGIPIHVSDRMLDLDAMLVPAPTGFHVWCNSLIQSEGRRRFSIAHEIVKAHGGKITVESVLGEGSVFSVWLPASADDNYRRE